MGDHLRQNVGGAVSPQSAEFFSLIIEGVHTDVSRFFLDQLAQTVPKVEDVRQFLILDNASWHKAARLNWHHFQPVYLPACLPDFNPIERLGPWLKTDWFWDFIARRDDALTERLCAVLRSFMDPPDKTASICAIRK